MVNYLKSRTIVLNTLYAVAAAILAFSDVMPTKVTVIASLIVSFLTVIFRVGDKRKEAKKAQLDKKPEKKEIATSPTDKAEALANVALAVEELVTGDNKDKK